MSKKVVALANEYAGAITEGKTYDVEEGVREFYAIINDKGKRGLYVTTMFVDEEIIVKEKRKRKNKVVEEEINDIEVHEELKNAIDTDDIEVNDVEIEDEDLESMIDTDDIKTEE